MLVAGNTVKAGIRRFNRSDLAGARRPFMDGLSLADKLLYAPGFGQCAFLLPFWHATYLRTLLRAVVARMTF